MYLKVSDIKGLVQKDSLKNEIERLINNKSLKTYSLEELNDD